MKGRLNPVRVFTMLSGEAQCATVMPQSAALEREKKFHLLTGKFNASEMHETDSFAEIVAEIFHSEIFHFPPPSPLSRELRSDSVVFADHPLKAADELEKKPRRKSLIFPGLGETRTGFH